MKFTNLIPTSGLLFASSFALLFAFAPLSHADAVTAPLGNQQISNFSEAKKIAARIHKENPVTIYCPCRYSGKEIDLASCGYQIHKDARRAHRLEWEHVVPAEAFGQSFAEWREGAAICHKHNGKPFRGRKCAETNPVFARMEADLYNLWPIVGELNGLRSNFSMAAIAGDTFNPPLSFGKCQAKIADRKFEPMDQYKGIVARTYLYMDQTYPGHGVISEKNRKLFEAWDKRFPVDAWECRRGRRIAEIQGNVNPVLEPRCRLVKQTVSPAQNSGAN